MSEDREHPVHDVLQVAGYSGAQVIQRQTNWQLWKANFERPGRTTEEEVLFLMADCGWLDLDAAVSAIGPASRHERLIVIRDGNQRFKENLDKVKRELAKIGPSDVVIQRDLLYRVIRRVLGMVEVKHLSADNLGLKYFVEPSLCFPGDRVAEHALAPLARWLRGERANEKHVAVLLAPAGTGKTTLVMELFRMIARERSLFYPLFVGREQWGELQPRKLVELRDIWATAIGSTYTGAMIGTEQVDTFLSTGALCPIFDGLDELCTFFPSYFNPDETVASVVKQFGQGRILLTSRSRFWSENVSPETREMILEIELLPFSQDQRERYVATRFPDSGERASRALTILERLKERAFTDEEREHQDRKGQLESIPFVVMLATESADTESPDIVSKYGHLLGSADPMEGLLLAFCAREEKRQQIPLSPEGQLRVLEVLATEFEGRFGAEDLQLALEADGLEAGSGLLARFKDHALLDAADGGFVLRFPFIHEYLMARAIARWFEQGGLSSGVRNALKACLSGRHSLIETCANLIRARRGEAWDALASKAWRESASDPFANSGFLNILIRLVKGSDNDSSRQATVRLLSIVGSSTSAEFQDLAFRGSINGLDLRDVRFVGCWFEDADWVGCKFDERTRFEGCRFTGNLAVTNCEGFGLVETDVRCVLSAPARTTFQLFQASKNSFPITRDQIREAIEDVLRRFRRGQLGFLTRTVDGVEGSVKRRISFAEELLECLEKQGVLLRFRQHDGFGYSVGDPHEAHTLLTNGVLIGNLKKTFEELVRKLDVH